MESLQQSVVQRLRATFPELPVYVEQPGQGVQGPAFYVSLLEGSQVKLLGRRYKLTDRFDIRYDPDPNSMEKNKECVQIAEQLLEQLAYIEWGGRLYRGQSMRHEIKEGELHFYVAFDVYLILTREPEPTMKKIEQRWHLQ
ncbi:hypothetical protein PAESOLCIP111_01963 [Paenibacillus solanacearum]|uniref:Uncharacterized protein n=1 Tax=Paenibacillus solanacearum TaxID=2048548 RepID=A0A916NII5_9BACL|nr:hypothetical protein [Paenibacillus solanacearum]CAG7616957.1 hypothetical protein PAESOLCIP111_01963 [Paenibacillus solanacearum]